jgi:Alginate lyase
MNAAGLLAGSKHWSQSDDDGLHAWMKAFLEWAQTSDNGKSEGAARNNHGSFYDEQIVVLALYLGKAEVAKATLEGVKTKRIAVQIEPDGAQPLELARADSFGYSRFNVMALCNLATLGQWAGVDLWHYAAPNGASLRKAIDFLLPYVEQPGKEWPYEHGPKNARDLTAQLWQTGLACNDQRYLQAARLSPAFPKSRDSLFFPAP